MNTISKEKFYTTIGSSIVTKRKELGLTQTELANKTGMSRTSIVNIEKGKQYPPVHLLWMISCALEATPADFFPENNSGIYVIEEDIPLKNVILKKAKKEDITEESISKIKSFVLGM
ncbi:helix-turn-helix domain-containing protein [Chryseobacterium gleum]|uniref:helix-turn-helix domain-containing protein n=1 Tax=Chryseobacterium gleum TaxID=250 RepID=UPI0028B229FE|nr:helix-turn-helix transcriptional regulator [Chryseobacterium gleum]